MAQRVQDQRQIAELRRVTGHLRAMQGDLPAARTSLTEAIDLLERLGMRRELTEARAELARLETREVLTGGSSEVADLSANDGQRTTPEPV